MKITKLSLSDRFDGWSFTTGMLRANLTPSLNMHGFQSWARKQCVAAVLCISFQENVVCIFGIFGFLFSIHNATLLRGLWCVLHVPNIDRTGAKRVRHNPLHCFCARSQSQKSSTDDKISKKELNKNKTETVFLPNPNRGAILRLPAHKLHFATTRPKTQPCLSAGFCSRWLLLIFSLDLVG